MELGQPAPPLPVARLVPPAPAEMVLTEETFQTYWGKGNDNRKGLGEYAGRLGFPLPAKAPPLEGTIYRFHKVRDETGSEAGNMKKRQAYAACNEVGDTRRLILHIQSGSGKKGKAKKGKGKKDQDKKCMKGLATQLKELNNKLLLKITEFVTLTGIGMTQPEHFLKFPVLNK